jgi:hypothetical protein
MEMEKDSKNESRGIISQWVIYNHPRDYPDHFVLRRWDIFAGDCVPSPDAVLAGTLEEIREHVPPGLYCLQRFANDDPSIVEVWI